MLDDIQSICLYFIETNSFFLSLQALFSYSFLCLGYMGLIIVQRNPYYDENNTDIFRFSWDILGSSEKYR